MYQTSAPTNDSLNFKRFSTKNVNISKDQKERLSSEFTRITFMHFMIVFALFNNCFYYFTPRQSIFSWHWKVTWFKNKRHSWSRTDNNNNQEAHEVDELLCTWL